MPRRSRPLLAWALAALAAGAAAAALRPVAVLEVRNEARGATTRIVVPGGGPFMVTSQHSMYDQPVSEEFVVGPGGELVLEAVSSPSAAVLEYFGITAPGQRHAVVRSMRRVVFRVAAGVPQRLRVDGEERSFLELGDHGDRLVLTATRTRALFALLRRGDARDGGCLRGESSPPAAEAPKAPGPLMAGRHRHDQLDGAPPWSP